MLGGRTDVETAFTHLGRAEVLGQPLLEPEGSPLVAALDQGVHELMKRCAVRGEIRAGVDDHRADVVALVDEYARDVRVVAVEQVVEVGLDFTMAAEGEDQRRRAGAGCNGRRHARQR